MESMVGRNAAPKGVDRKSEGRSVWWFRSHISEDNESRILRNAPLTHDGIDPPVRNPMQSFVKELQLKSSESTW